MLRCFECVYWSGYSGAERRADAARGGRAPPPANRTNNNRAALQAWAQENWGPCPWHTGWCFEYIHQESCRKGRDCIFCHGLDDPRLREERDARAAKAKGKGTKGRGG
jgi:hypothetical protein